MTVLPVPVRPLGTSLLLVGLLAACATAPPSNPARQAEAAACRTRADAVFQKQNRYLLSERGNLDAPGSGSDPDYDKSIGTPFLAGRFGRDQDVAACESGGGVTPSPGTLPATGDASTAAPNP